MKKPMSTGAILLVTIFANTAVAQTTAQCVEAFEQGQELELAKKLVSARDRFKTCAATSCPTSMSNDCAKRFTDVNAKVPSVVFEVRSGGAFVSDVAVEMDGAPLAAKLDGTAIEVDPGEHKFVFTSKDGRNVEVTTTVLQGKKEQHVSAALPEIAKPEPVASSVPAPTAPAATASTDGGSTGSGQRIAGMVVGGLGLVGLGVGYAIRASAHASYDDAIASCTNGLCPRDAADRADAARGSATLGGALAIAGAVAVVGGIVLFVTSPTRKTETAVGVGANGVFLTGRF